MASGGQQFPPQTQDKQPGREHEMDPAPGIVSPNYKPADKLRNKVALVTGGDSGIGRAVCRHFALEGATVAFTYFKELEGKDAEDTLRMIKEDKKSVGTEAKDPVAIPEDLGYEENCKKVVTEVVGKYGRIDVLVNNAAEQYVNTNIEDISEQQLGRKFRTNVYSNFYTARSASKCMGKGSSIINTTSVNAYKGNDKLLGNTATKGAIVAFNRALSLQLAARGIRMNGVSPGPVWTPLIPASFSKEHVAHFGKQVPMGRAAQAREIAASNVFLASQDSSYYTGQVLHPNGGAIVNG